MRTKRGIGSPSGGRVHWLLMFLPKDFIKAYKLTFDYEYHNYKFVRYNDRTARDEFTVVRTSRSCFRVMYFNYATLYFEYFAERTPKRCADKIYALFEKIRSVEKNEGK